MSRSFTLFGVDVHATTYAKATRAILDAAEGGQSFGATALATHGLMLASRDATFRAQVNSLHLVTPDGQPVRWALNALYRTQLSDRVYGPDLVSSVCAEAARRGVGVYLFGSTPEVCNLFAKALQRDNAGLQVVGIQPDRFREASPAEDASDIERINSSGAGVVLVGRGCPRQERWVADHIGQVNAAMIAVGAAFDYHAGTLQKPPKWMQRNGLEWLFRLTQDPKRLFRRYLVYNSLFMAAFTTELARRSVRRLRRG